MPESTGLKRNLSIAIGLAVWTALMGPAARADVISVDPNHYPTIQAAIDAASDDDVIVVAPGVYFESIDFLGKAITVQSAIGAPFTTIDANSSESTAVRCVSGESRDSVLDGFTIVNGFGDGGGIEISGSPTIRNCDIRENFGFVAGGIAVYAKSDPLIQHCIIEGNTGGFGRALGGSFATAGISFDLASGTVRDCRISGNFGWEAGGISVNNSDVQFVNCLIIGNQTDSAGGGAAIRGTTSTRFIHCTIVGNSASFGGGGIGIDFGSPSVWNSIVWGNSPDGIGFTGLRGTMTLVQFSDLQEVWTGSGSGNISDDPQFLDAKGDFRLSAGSPCIDSANNGLTPPGLSIDLRGNPRFLDDLATPDCAQLPGACGTAPISDMGAYEFCGGAHEIVVFGVPFSSPAGAFLTPGVVILDQCGDVVTDDDRAITLSLSSNPTGGTLEGTLTRSTVNGFAMWTPDEALTILKAGDKYRMRATADGAAMSGSNIGESNYFDIVPGPGDHLVYVEQPSDTTAGDPIQPVVALVDAYENLVPDDVRLIVLEIGANPGNGELGGAFFALTSGGIAEWSIAEQVNIKNAGTGYTLVAYDAGSLERGIVAVESEPFDIVAGPAQQMHFSTQPTDTTAGATISAAVTLLDLYGNVAVTDERPIALSIDSNPGNATLGGTIVVGVSAGVATWSIPQHLNITVADAGYTLRASSAADFRGFPVPDAISGTFRIHPGTPSKLAFGTQPSHAAPGTAIAQPVTVRVLDNFDNFVSNAGNSVSLAIENNPGGATLNGAGPVAASGGVATFANLSLSAAGDGYTLRASSNGLGSALSQPFNVFVINTPAPQPTPNPDLGLILDGDAQSALIALLFRNSLCGLGAAAYVPFMVLGLLGARQRLRRRQRRPRRPAE